MSKTHQSGVTTYTAGGKTVTMVRQVREGILRVEDTYQAVMSDFKLDGPLGYSLTLRRAWLDGNLILDPVRAQALADEACIPNPPRLSEAED